MFARNLFIARVIGVDLQIKYLREEGLLSISIWVGRTDSAW
jgi:hypothetical protein